MTAATAISLTYTLREQKRLLFPFSCAFILNEARPTQQAGLLSGPSLPTIEVEP